MVDKNEQWIYGIISLSESLRFGQLIDDHFKWSIEALIDKLSISA